MTQVPLRPRVASTNAAGWPPKHPHLSRRSPLLSETHFSGCLWRGYFRSNTPSLECVQHSWYRTWVSGDIESTLAALTNAGVKYLVVGGVAVVMHGYLRVTADLDLVLKLERSNLEKAVAALEGLGFRPRAPVPLIQFADREIRESWIRDKGLTVFSLWSPEHLGFELDLFVREPFDFESVYENAARVQLESCVATIIPLEALIALKESVGRPRDVEDVAALRALSENYGKI